jgi:predicted metalloprotease with PDZ domain
MRMRTARFLITVFVLCARGPSGLSQCHFPASAANQVLSYSFAPIFVGRAMQMRVTLSFPGSATGSSKLELPSRWAGQLHLEASVTDLTALSDDTRVSDSSSPSERQLHYPPGAPVRISYVLVKDWTGPLDGDKRFRSNLSTESFHLIGLTALAHPDLDYGSIVNARFDWQDLPAGWTLATSFATGERCQSFRGSLHDALASLFVGGDYRIHRTMIDGRPVSFAMRGIWNFTDEEWVTQASRIIQYERSFWKDNNFPYFLVTLTPFDGDYGNTGTSLTRAFMMHISPSSTLNSDTLAILAHEAFHAWNPGRIGDPGAPGYEVSWFTEGFTRYYQDLLLYRAGLMTLPEYVSHINGRLRQYALGEGLNRSLEEFVALHTADNSALSQLDYRRGDLIAFWLDTTIRKQSRDRATLDTLMFALEAQDTSYRRHQGNRPAPLTARRILLAAGRYLRPDTTSELRGFFEQGGPVMLPPDALGPCFTSQVVDSPSFDLGFESSTTKSGNRMVANVEPASNAYKAGVRSGQTVTGWSYTTDDSTKPVRLTLQTAQGLQVIHYIPQGPTVLLQQFMYDQNKDCPSQM